MRRWLLRLLLLWAISGAFFYMFGLNMLLDALSDKAQTQAMTQCRAQLLNEKLVGSPDSPLTMQRGEKYCQCVSSGLILTKDDVFELVQHKPATRLNAVSKERVETCNAELQNELRAPASTTPAPVAPATPQDPSLIHL